MRIVCAGGGPAGLYFAIQMKQRDPSHRITVIERNRSDDTFGWGVVFSDETLRNLEGADPPSKQEILDSFAHWDDIDIHFKGRVITSGGHGFCGIERRHLLNILQRRAASLGVELIFQREVDDVAAFPDADLIVAADGINSRIRNRYADAFQAGDRHQKQQVRLARHASDVPGVHVHIRRDRVRLVPGACLSLQSRHIHLHRRNHRAELARRWPRSARCRRYERLLRAIVRALAGGPPADVEHEPSARFAMALLPARHQRDMGDGQRRADGRCGAFRAFLDRVWHQACAGGCDRAGTRLRYPRHRRAGRSCGLRGRAQGRRAAHPVRGAQLDRMVRERGTLRPPGAGAIRLLPAYAQPAHKPRESPPARSTVARTHGAVACRSRGTSRRPCCPADVPAVPVARNAACQPRRGLADGDLQRTGRHAQRLPSGPSRCACAGRRRAGVHRDGLRHAARPHHTWLRGAVVGRTDGGMGAHRRFRACAIGREVLPAARSFRPEGFDPTRLAGDGRAACRWELGGDRAFASALEPAQSNPSPDDAG